MPNKINLTPMTPAERHIFKCWRNGTGISQTIKLHKVKGFSQLEYEEVRLKFVRFCERFG